MAVGVLAGHLTLRLPHPCGQLRDLRRIVSISNVNDKGSVPALLAVTANRKNTSPPLAGFCCAADAQLGVERLGRLPAEPSY